MIDGRLGARIKWQRHLAGWTQAELAAAVGRSQPAVAQWETGKRRPSQPMRRRLAAVFGVDPARFYCEEALR